MAETVVYTPENSGNSVPAWMAMNNNGLFGNNGWGGGILGFFLGLLFGNGFGGWGGFGNGFGGGAGAGFLSNQINNDNGRDLLMQAITSQGEASRTAVQSLSTMLGQDFNLVNGAIQTLQGGLSSLALQQAVSVPQIINSIQSGNSALASQLCECCCNMKQLVTSQGYENQIATLNQTNALGSAISGSGQRTVDAIADLKTTMVKEFCDAKERDMQEKIDGLLSANSNLRSQIDNAQQTAAITDGILACLYDAHAPQGIMDQAEDLMASCQMNCGFTYTNSYRKRAVVLIGPTTNGSEFVNTLSHELYHLSVAIADSLGIDLLGERPAYMIGETMREFADLVCSMGCDHCRQKD